ncbi:MAG TPA: DUF308 domain-containing protein [Acidimicrobiia bacterium]|nr:DUF308 domain-containing protein [Acidimicrobiia bacterium]
MTSATIGDSGNDEMLAEAASWWWLFLITGIIWLLFGWVVLSARSNITTVWAVVVYAGILFFIVGAGEIAAAFVADSYRWVHALLGIASVAAGVIAFVWPDETFVTLAALLAWFLLFHGTVEFVAALAGRHEYDLWWMRLILGVIEVAIGFWAIGYAGRSIVLLVIWVGATALAKGIGSIIAAFELRSERRRLTTV